MLFGKSIWFREFFQKTIFFKIPVCTMNFSARKSSFPFRSKWATNASSRKALSITWLRPAPPVFPRLFCANPVSRQFSRSCWVFEKKERCGIDVGFFCSFFSLQERASASAAKCRELKKVRPSIGEGVVLFSPSFLSRSFFNRKRKMEGLRTGRFACDGGHCGADNADPADPVPEGRHPQPYPWVQQSFRKRASPEILFSLGENLPAHTLLSHHMSSVLFLSKLVVETKENYRKIFFFQLLMCEPVSKRSSTALATR